MKFLFCADLQFQKCCTMTRSSLNVSPQPSFYYHILFYLSLSPSIKQTHLFCPAFNTNDLISVVMYTPVHFFKVSELLLGTFFTFAQTTWTIFLQERSQILHYRYYSCSLRSFRYFSRFRKSITSLFVQTLASDILPAG